MIKNVTVICDMQFGSTGKGLIAGYLAERDKPDVVATAWSMNAGHTYINTHSRKFVHCMLANGVVSPNLKTILIGPGSQIGIDKLISEAESCKDLLYGVRVLIHENACVIQQRHIDQENLTMVGIGSTKKGCGAALAEKIARQVEARIVARNFADKIEDMAALRDLNIKVVDSSDYNKVIHSAKRIQVEGAQGFSLGINSGFYPYTTSRECTPAQIMVDCGIPIAKLEKVVGTLRTYPIRVANRYDDNGTMVGWSGPCYPDQQEIQWSDLNMVPELTTVTQLPRRIFTFSMRQLFDAITMCAPDEIFLNFANYIGDKELDQLIHSIDSAALNVLGHKAVRYIGFGPSSEHVHARY